MTTLTHSVDLLYIKSVDKIITTLNSLPNIKCTVESTSISSTILSIELNFDVSHSDVLSLGTLIGSIQVGSLI